MDLGDFIFVDKSGDVFMPDIFLAFDIIITLASTMGYTGMRYARWLRRNNASQHVSPTGQLPVDVNLRGATQPLKRHRPSPQGSPKKKSRRELGVEGGVSKGCTKLRLQRIPRHRFTRSEILEMVKVPGAPVVRMSMMGRREASDVPSAEVAFASPGDCDRVYSEVKTPLERDGIWVSQV